MAVLTLPVVIVATEEALRAVPRELREASLALGATKFQTVMHVVLPQAAPGILTGTILAVSRGAGEVAPILFTGAAYFLPQPAPSTFRLSSCSSATTSTCSSTQSPDVDATKPILYATVLVLLVLTFTLNMAAVIVRRPDAPAPRGARGRDRQRRPPSPSRTPKLVVRNSDRLLRRARRRSARSAMDIPGQHVTALIGPSGCGKSTFLRSLNRMNELIPGCRVEGDVQLDGDPIYGPGDRPGGGAPAHRHGVPALEPLPQVDLRERRLRAAHRRASATRASSPARVERALHAGGAVGRGQGPPERQRAGPLRRPAAAAVHRARAGGRARGAADGRAGLGARSDRHRAHRGADPRAVRATTRSSS